MEFHIKWSWNIYFICLLLAKNTTAQSCHSFSRHLTNDRQLLCSGFKKILNTNQIQNVFEETTSFSKNAITDLNNLSFSTRFNNVKELYLDNNQIKSIEPLTFKNLPKLKVINLSYNSIEFLHPELFKFNKELEVIDLTGNKIDHIDVAFLQELSSLKELLLLNNPIYCNNCETMQVLNYFENYIKSLNNYCEHLNDTCIYVIFVFVFAITLSIIMIGLATAYLFKCTVPKKQNRRRRRGRSERSENCLLTNEKPLIGEDGYLVPTIPANVPQYTSVMRSLEKLNISTLNPLKPEESTLETASVDTHKIITPSYDYAYNFISEIKNGEDTNFHVYEELQDVKEKRFYRRFADVERYGRIKV